MSVVNPSAVHAAEAFFEALEQHDLDLVAPLLADDVVEFIPFSNTGDPAPWAVFGGKEAVLGYLGTITQNFSRNVLADKKYSVADDGDTVFVEATGDLIHAETGASYQNVYVFKIETRAGQIVRIDEYANPITAAKLFGMPIG